MDCTCCRASPTRTVLIVEDESTLCEVIATVLHEEGYVAVQAPDGAQALALAADSPPDLILTDIMMPVMNGLELLRALADSERLRSIPVIVMTASPPTLLEGREVAGLLRKPFTREALLSVIAAVLERVAAAKREATG